jgi:hypothetical protein
MKNLILVCEAQVQLGVSADEAQNPNGKIEARATTWGAREGADGRKFNYKPEGFMDWADEFNQAEKPMPMFLNHNDMGMPVGEWNEFNFTKTGMVSIKVLCSLSVMTYEELRTTCVTSSVSH